jgi:hypothetical protein
MSFLQKLRMRPKVDNLSGQKKIPPESFLDLSNIGQTDEGKESVFSTNQIQKKYRNKLKIT